MIRGTGLLPLMSPSLITFLWAAGGLGSVAVYGALGSTGREPETSAPSGPDALTCLVLLP